MINSYSTCLPPDQGATASVSREMTFILCPTRRLYRFCRAFVTVAQVVVSVSEDACEMYLQHLIRLISHLTEQHLVSLPLASCKLLRGGEIDCARST